MNSPAMRGALSLPIAVVVTIGLFWLMAYLIATGIPAIQEQIESVPIDFARVDRDESVQTKDRELPDKPDQVEAPPPPPPMSAAASSAPNSGGVGMNAPRITNDLDIANEIGTPNEGDAIPLVRVPPQYPQRAASRGIQGWVQLEFTITETGAVEDIVVIAADPPGYFESAAERALSRWKYKPKIDNGTPVRRYDNQVVITFELDE